MIVRFGYRYPNKSLNCGHWLASSFSINADSKLSYISEKAHVQINCKTPMESRDRPGSSNLNCSRELEHCISDAGVVILRSHLSAMIRIVQIMDANDTTMV
jgi:hypothetical protein